jgi:hypothetical protein
MIDHDQNLGIPHLLQFPSILELQNQQPRLYSIELEHMRYIQASSHPG